MSRIERVFRLTAISAALLATYGLVQAAEELAQAAEEPAQAAEQPAQPVEEPAQPAEEPPPQAAEEPVQPAEEPVQAVEEPVQPAQEPAQAAEQPVKPEEEPAQAAEDTEEAEDAEDDEIVRLVKPESSVSLGVGNWTSDRPHEGIFDGMRDSGAYGLLDAEIVKRDDATGTWYSLTGRNLGLDSREVQAEYLRQGNLGLSLEYSRIPRDNPFRINTGLQGIGTTSLTVSGAGASAFPFRDVTLGTTRDRTQLAIYKNLMPGLDFNISFRNEEKSGTRHWGRGSAAEFAVEPIDSATRQVEMTLSYAAEKLQLSGGYYGSMYDTDNSLVTVITNGALATTTTYLSLPLDNQAHQLFVNGGYNFTSSTRGTFKISYSRATQDEHLPTTDIAGLSLAGGPTSLDGEVNTTLVHLGLSSRPVENLSVVANARLHDVQDDTPTRRYVETNAACGSGQCVDNTPFSYRTLTGKLEATYRLPADYSLTAGVEQRYQDRSVPVANANGAGGTDTQRVVPMRAEVDEITGRLELRRSLSETVNGSLAFLHSERDGSTYVSAAAGPGGAPSDLINPIHIADRNRDKVRLALDWAPLENLSLQFGYEEARDKYAHDASRPYGLQDGSAQLFSVDGNYVVNDNWQITVWYSRDNAKATQFGQRAAIAASTSLNELAAAVKDARLEDTGDSIGLGLLGQATSRLKLGADVQWTRSLSQYAESLTTSGTGSTYPVTPSGVTVVPLKDIENTLIRVGLFGDYALRKDSNVRLDLIYERWHTDDWTWQFADGTPFIYGTTTDGTTVNAEPTQESVFVGVRYVFRFQ